MAPHPAAMARAASPAVVMPLTTTGMGDSAATCLTASHPGPATQHTINVTEQPRGWYTYEHTHCDVAQKSTHLRRLHPPRPQTHVHRLLRHCTPLPPRPSHAAPPPGPVPTQSKSQKCAENAVVCQTLEVLLSTHCPLPVPTPRRPTQPLLCVCHHCSHTTRIQTMLRFSQGQQSVNTRETGAQTAVGQCRVCAWPRRCTYSSRAERS